MDLSEHWGCLLGQPVSLQQPAHSNTDEDELERCARSGCDNFPSHHAVYAGPCAVPQFYAQDVLRLVVILSGNVMQCFNSHNA